MLTIEKIFPYLPLQHLSNCNKSQYWQEAIDALSYPLWDGDVFEGDEEWQRQEALNDCIKRSKTCNCGLNEILEELIVFKFNKIG